MKPRVIRAHKILAVALTTTASACAPGVAATTGGPAGPETASPEVVVAAVPSPAAADTQPAASTPAPADANDEAPARAQPVSPPSTPASAASAASAPAEDPKLVALREELLDARGRGQSQVARFRPLCDRDGYPLVGNVVRGKGGPPQPSAFCSEVRRAAGR
jgi:hypothetical protein